METKKVKISELTPDNINANKGTVRGAAMLEKSLREYGAGRSVLVDKSGRIIAGNKTIEAAGSIGLENALMVETDGTQVVVVKRTDLDLDSPQGRGLAIADNRVAEVGLEWDLEALEKIGEELDLGEFWFPEELELPSIDFSDETEDPNGNEAPEEVHHGALAERYMVAPFSVISARGGDWQNRKRAWKALGIESELGRDDELLFKATGFLKDRVEKSGGSTSIFDPVLCELMYRWFTPIGGSILDPFAGGSVRGIVAAKLARKYTGVELRGEQVKANRAQAKRLCATRDECFRETVADIEEITPIEQHGGFNVKRDDLFDVNGVNGGKVRTCFQLARGAKGLVTAGSRQSPQVNIVAQVAKHLGIPCRVHTPEGELSPEVIAAKEAGATVIQHKAGYNNVIISRARKDAEETGFREIPFGMECVEAVKMTSIQTQNIPQDTKRIVMPVGSGMSLAGVLSGLKQRKMNVPVLGIVVGADPSKRLDKYAPKNWRNMVTLVTSDLDYHDHAKQKHLGDLRLDEVYEAKCLEFLEPGDLLWVVGIRQTSKPQECPMPVWIQGDSRTAQPDEEFDFVFSCPPYADLEVYSDDPADLSNLGYEDFRAAYRDIIAESVKRLKDNRFAAFVVGEVRGKGGAYYNFVGDTIQAFIDAGASYYNEAIFVTPVGTLPLRTGRAFSASRKLGKTHQNILVFCKGDAGKAAKFCGFVDVEQALTLAEADGENEQEEIER